MHLSVNQTFYSLFSHFQQSVPLNFRNIYHYVNVGILSLKDTCPADNWYLYFDLFVDIQDNADDFCGEF